MNWLERASYGFLRCREHHLEKRCLSLLFFNRFFRESTELLSTVFAEEPLA
jgi:hypothetical protein